MSFGLIFGFDKQRCESVIGEVDVDGSGDLDYDEFEYLVNTLDSENALGGKFRSRESSSKQNQKNEWGDRLRMLGGCATS